MRPLASITLCALLSVLTAEGAAAQWNVARFDANANRTYATYGFDPAFVAGVGYGRVIPVWGSLLPVAAAHGHCAYTA